MQVGRRFMIPAVVLLCAVALPGGAVPAAAGWIGGGVRLAGEPGGQGANVDLAVRQVTVTPVRAFVGETVRIEAVVENKDEGMGTTRAEVQANGKVVAHQLFTWGLSPGDRLYRLKFEWDTAGFPPGEYRIRAEAFVWTDTSSFDNRLDVGQTVVLVPPGGAFPGGAAAGGSATETDPRFTKGAGGG